MARTWQTGFGPTGGGQIGGKTAGQAENTAAAYRQAHANTWRTKFGSVALFHTENERHGKSPCNTHRRRRSESRRGPALHKNTAEHLAGQARYIADTWRAHGGQSLEARPKQANTSPTLSFCGGCCMFKAGTQNAFPTNIFFVLCSANRIVHMSIAAWECRRACSAMWGKTCSIARDNTLYDLIDMKAKNHNIKT